MLPVIGIGMGVGVEIDLSINELSRSLNVDTKLCVINALAAHRRFINWQMNSGEGKSQKL